MTEMDTLGRTKTAASGGDWGRRPPGPSPGRALLPPRASILGKAEQDEDGAGDQEQRWVSPENVDGMLMKRTQVFRSICAVSDWTYQVLFLVSGGLWTFSSVKR